MEGDECDFQYFRCAKISNHKFLFGQQSVALHGWDTMVTKQKYLGTVPGNSI